MHTPMTPALRRMPSLPAALLWAVTALVPPLAIAGPGDVDHGTPVSYVLMALGYGLVVLVVAIAIVTLRREARRTRELNAALQEQRDLLHVFTEGVEHSAVFMLDPEGRIKNWNPGAERMFGYKPREVIGKNYLFLYPKDEVQAGRA